MRSCPASRSWERGEHRIAWETSFGQAKGTMRLPEGRAAVGLATVGLAAVALAAVGLATVGLGAGGLGAKEWKKD